MPHTEPSRNAGYETSDASARTLLAWGGGLVAVVIAAAITTWLLFDALAAHAKRTDPKVSPLAATETSAPPEPRLLTKEPEDLAAVRKEEDRVLRSYDWVDRERGVVRMPIERALELVAKEGLPSRPASRKAP
jgi:hypothetical protein